jgi:hypothetical protein
MSFLSVLLVSGKYGTRHSTDLSEASGCVHIAILKQPCWLGTREDLSFDLQAVSSTARLDSAYTVFRR